jgi:hypothetical protein
MRVCGCAVPTAFLPLTRIRREPPDAEAIHVSVATASINAGDDPKLVATFLNHKSFATTKKFYATFAVPAKATTLR